MKSTNITQQTKTMRLPLALDTRYEHEKFNDAIDAICEDVTEYIENCSQDLEPLDLNYIRRIFHFAKKYNGKN